SFDLRRWTDAEIAAADCEARLRLADFSLAMPQSYSFTVATDSADVVFYSSALTRYPCLLKLNNQVVRTRIHIENLLPYWLSPTENLYVSAEVAAEAVRLEDWAYLMDGKTEAKPVPAPVSVSDSGKAPAIWRKRLLDHLHLTFTLQAGFIYDAHGPFENLSGRVYYTPDYLQLDDLALEAYDGRLSGNVRLDFGPADSLSLSLAGRMDSVQIDRVFAAFNDFGQRQITSEQIKGALDMDFEMQAAWSPKRVFDAGKLAFSSDLHLRNGSLYQVAALRKLSKFTGEADLEHIRFADLRNHIDIVDRRVVIPRMSIESSLLNLDFSGVHRFDNTVDYRIDIELSDFLSRRRKQRALEKELGLVVTNTERLRLPIQIVGPMADPTIRYDMATAREHRQEKFAKEREQIRAAFAAEKQRSRTGRDERKPVPMPSVPERNEFVMEFEDDAVQAPAPAAPASPEQP
ncbi:MAG: AsmA-like C-terminal region-containing protein, partial [Bacteroidales bacterium]|nr:AsmA-like C-terminal region-containing protein [Bacteroidales bacterium]